MLGMAYIRVYEIATFYTMFQLSPVGKKAHVWVCGTTPCMLRGSEALIEVCKRAHQPSSRTSSRRTATSPGRRSSAWACCANAPMVQIGKDTYEDLTPSCSRRCSTALRRASRRSPARRSAARPRARRAGRRRSRTIAKVARRYEANRGQRRMLEDKDRIFKQPLRLPGLAPRRRARARRLGQHQGADRQGPRLDHQRGQGLGPARAAAAPASRPASSGRSCPRAIRGPPTSSSMPTSASPAPARTARSCGTIRTC